MLKKYIFLALFFVLSFSSPFIGNICELEKEIGPCRAAFPRIFYNSEINQCEEFIYGGCGGNKNNFGSIKECEITCFKHELLEVLGDDNKEEDRICYLPPITGRCEAYIPSYFFNSRERRCEEFIYGGCGGNENRFHTLEECEKKCSNTINICNLPSVIGNCKANFKRFFFNGKECVEFIYGGCEGNGNNFESKENCENKCK